MSTLEIISIVLIILYGILAVLFMFLNDNIKDLKMLMAKQTSLFRTMLNLLTDDEEDEEETPAPEDDDSKHQYSAQRMFDIITECRLLLDYHWEDIDIKQKLKERLKELEDLMING